MKRRLLNEGEVDQLNQHAEADQPQVLLQWAAITINQAVTKDMASAAIGYKLVDHLLQISFHQEAVVNASVLQVPFQYFHLLNSMIMANCFLLAWALGNMRSWFVPGAYMISSTIFIGMMDLASKLSDPFGEDEVDFDLDRWADLEIEVALAMLDGHVVGREAGLKKLLEEGLPLPLEKDGEAAAEFLSDRWPERPLLLDSA